MAIVNKELMYGNWKCREIYAGWEIVTPVNFFDVQHLFS